MEIFQEFINKNNTFIDIDNDYYYELFKKQPNDQSSWKFRLIINSKSENETSVQAFKLTNDRIDPDYQFIRRYSSSSNIRIKEIIDELLKSFDWGASIDPVKNEEESKLYPDQDSIINSVISNNSVSVVYQNDVSKNRGLLENINKKQVNESGVQKSLSDVEFSHRAIVEASVDLLDFDN